MGYAKSRTKAYARLEGYMGKTFETGRDLEGIEPVEYWESLFLEAYDIGRESVLRRDGGEVIDGGGGGAWLGFGGEAPGTGEVTGDEVDGISVIVVMPRSNKKAESGEARAIWRTRPRSPN